MCRVATLASAWMVGGDRARRCDNGRTLGVRRDAHAACSSSRMRQFSLPFRSEAQNGTTQFLGYDFGGGVLLAPPARKARRLEIIGDSVSSGYGVEGVGLGPTCPGPNYAARYENFRVSMGGPYLPARSGRPVRAHGL